MVEQCQLRAILANEDFHYCRDCVDKVCGDTICPACIHNRSMASGLRQDRDHWRSKSELLQKDRDALVAERNTLRTRWWGAEELLEREATRHAWWQHRAKLWKLCAKEWRGLWIQFGADLRRLGVGG